MSDQLGKIAQSRAAHAALISTGLQLASHGRTMDNAAQRPPLRITPPFHFAYIPA